VGTERNRRGRRVGSRRSRRWSRGAWRKALSTYQGRHGGHKLVSQPTEPL